MSLEILSSSVFLKMPAPVILEEEVWTYDLLPILDLMICIATSSVGLEGLMRESRVIYCDESGFREHPYERYDPFLVARSPEGLLERVDRVLPGVSTWLQTPWRSSGNTTGSGSTARLSSGSAV